MESRDECNRLESSQTEQHDVLPGSVEEQSISSVATDDSEADIQDDLKDSNSSDSDQVAAKKNLRRSMTGLSTFSASVRFSTSKPLFETIDIEDVREHLSAPLHAFEVEELYHRSGMFQKIARSHLFQGAALGAIVLYTGWIGIDTDYNTASTLIEAPGIFIAVENLFCFFFTLEIVIRFCAYANKCAAFQDMWFLFDLVLVVVMIAETWVLSAFLLATKQPDEDAGEVEMGGTNYGMRIMRLLRLTRLVKTVRLLRMLPELLIMVKGMLAAARSVCMTLALTLLIVYVFGIAIKQSASDTAAGDRYFSSVGQSMASLLLFATLLDGPSVVLAELNFMSAAIFCLVIGLSSLLLLNMLIGVLCEVVADVKETEIEHLDEVAMRELLLKILQKIDIDGNDKISRHELEQIIKDPEATNLLQNANVDLMTLLDMSDMVFQSDSTGDAYDKELSLDEFMKVIMPLRSTNKASVKDVLRLRKFLNDSNTKTLSSIDRVEDRLRFMETKLRTLTSSLEHTFPQMLLFKATASNGKAVGFASESKTVSFDNHSANADAEGGLISQKSAPLLITRAKSMSAEIGKAKSMTPQIARAKSMSPEVEHEAGKTGGTLEELRVQVASLLQQQALSSKHQAMLHEQLLQSQQQQASITAQLEALQASLLQASEATWPTQNALS
eukprot:TRINITY_DN4698_c0_g2_i1.p1 TRINITY_DN4698_c0_g2~~TRINITY_DN4698_c0_g2_i1.p1  ORF type:complete len:671 (+),score=122.21 TRINITY_DN4698_c0_g2_i1:102-2114(+)